MTDPDEPYALRDATERTRRLSMLDLPHVRPLTTYLAAIKQEKGSGYDMPSFDPCDGGVEAKVLFLLEAPGAKAVGSTFISRNNPDQTARNMNLLLKEAGLARKDTLLWNIVPWYVGDGGRIRPVSSADIAEAAPSLGGLISLLKSLRAVVLVGGKAQSASDVVRRLTAVPVVSAPHPSPRVFNVWPEKRQQALAAFASLRAFLSDSPVDATVAASE